MRIVCGTDFSVHAAEAGLVAAELSMRLGATLLLVHVAENSGLGATVPEVFDHFKSTVAGRLHEEAERLRTLGATVKEELLTGSPHEALVEAGHRPNTRLVVVSSLGRVAPSRLLIGSVAERTAENSSVPTLVVRDPAPFQAWARGERPLKILVGYDFSGTSDMALRWVGELNKIGPCDLTVEHVFWPPQENWRFGTGDRMWVEDTPPAIQQLLDRDLKEKLRHLLGQKKVTIRVQSGWGRPETELIESARAGQADLIVVGTNQRHGVSRMWLGSVSRGVLRDAPMSVAVVPMGKKSESVGIPEFSRALATTDFSDLGNRAIPFAYSALRRGGSLCLLHVMEPQHQTTEANAVDAMRSKLRTLIPADAEDLGIKTDLAIVESRTPAQAICQTAERFGAHLICMASHGRSGLSEAILGSVAHEVMRCSKRPVLVVRSTGS